MFKTISRIDTTNGLRFYDAAGTLLLDLSGAKLPKSAGKVDPVKVQAALNVMFPKEQGEQILVHLYPNGTFAVMLSHNPDVPIPAEWWT